MYDLSQKMQQRGHFRDNFLLSWPKVDSIFRTFSLFLSLIVRQSKVVRSVYERANESNPLRIAGYVFLVEVMAANFIDFSKYQKIRY